MSRNTTLRGRLLVTYLALVSVVVVAMFATVRFLTPNLFQQRIQAGRGDGQGRGAGSGGAGLAVPGDVHDAYDQALTIALAIAVGIGLILAVVLATWLTRRMLRSLNDVKVAANRLAAGEYNQSIAIPKETELADLVESIESLRHALAATDQTRAELVSDLAHEIRNPLATIEGYMEGLIDGILPANDDTYTTVAHEAHRLQRLTKDLSLLAQAQEGALDLDVATTNLAHIARGVVVRLTPQYDAKGVLITQHLSTDLPVKGDTDRLTQVLTNIVGNALTHTPSGGRVKVVGVHAVDQCIINISDTGRGLSAEERSAVFARFIRFDPQSSGTGLGLNIAQNIVQLHGGNITVHSDGLGQGTTFTVSIPSAGDK